MLFYITRLEAKVERLEGKIQVKDREIATITRTVRYLEYFEMEIFDVFCIIDVFELCIRKPNPQQPLRPKLTSCSRKEMSFKEL